MAILMFGKNPEYMKYFTDSYFRNIDNRQGMDYWGELCAYTLPSVCSQPEGNLSENLQEDNKEKDCIEEKKG